MAVIEITNDILSEISWQQTHLPRANVPWLYTNSVQLAVLSDDKKHWQLTYLLTIKAL